MHLKISSAKWQPFWPGGDELTHWGPICISKPGHHWFRSWLIWPVWGLFGPSQHLNQCGLIINCTPFSFKKMNLEVSSTKWQNFCHSFKVLIRLMYSCLSRLNTLRPRRNERHFADDIFKRIFFNENVWISTQISLKFVPKGPINNIPALVQIMAWHHSGDKSLFEPMMVSLPMHICVTRPQWVK